MAYSKTHGIRCSLELVKPKAALVRSGSIAVIPGGEVLGVFGAKHPPHVALANLLDNEKAVLKFVEARIAQGASGCRLLSLRHEPHVSTTRYFARKAWEG